VIRLGTAIQRDVLDSQRNLQIRVSCCHAISRLKPAYRYSCVPPFVGDLASIVGHISIIMARLHTDCISVACRALRSSTNSNLARVWNLISSFKGVSHKPVFRLLQKPLLLMWNFECMQFRLCYQNTQLTDVSEGLVLLYTFLSVSKTVLHKTYVCTLSVRSADSEI
jgi:hypothetical protein